jgi:hypothetical protein
MMTTMKTKAPYLKPHVGVATHDERCIKTTRQGR